MDSYQTTLEAWDKVAGLYQDSFMGLDLYNATYDAMLAQLPAGQARVLEIGCGPGNIAHYLLAKRSELDVLGTDTSPAMLAHAQANNPTARFLQMDARDLHQLEGPFDAVVCGFVLPYLARPAFENLLQEAVRLLSPHGLLYLSTIEGNYAQSGYESGSDKSIQMYVYYYSEAEIEAALQHHGFAVRSCTKLPYTTSKGKATTHLVFLASRS